MRNARITMACARIWECRSSWQENAEETPLSRLTVQFDVTAMGVDDMLDDGQAESRASHFA